MAQTAPLSPLQMFTNIAQLDFVRQLTLMAGIAASIALGVAVVLWSSTPEQKVLFADLSPQDVSKVTAALDQNGLEYSIDSRSGAVTVPASDLHKTRLKIASYGLPPNSSRGYAILDKEQSLGTSNFMERARFNLAIQDELTRSIESINSVRSARVHLAIPKQTSFLRNRSKPSASVLVNLLPGTSLGDSQVAGIVHLISSSVTGLSTSDVSIVDQQGNLLSSNKDANGYSSTEHFRFTRQLEEDYTNRIVSLLSSIVGANNVRAEVSATIDFTAVETTRENYDPDKTIIRSEQTSEERNAGQNSGSAGDLSATPPSADGPEGDSMSASNSMQTTTRATRNYEIDRTISHIREAPGSLKSLSIAVLVDYPEPVATKGKGKKGKKDSDSSAAEAKIDAEIERLKKVVKEAVGFNEARGDRLTFINTDFATPPPMEELEAPPVWEEPWIWEVAKQALAGIVVLFLIFGILRPTMRSMAAAVPSKIRLPAPAGGGAVAAVAGADGTGYVDGLPEDQVTLAGSPQAQLPPTEISPYQRNLDDARNIVRQEPAKAVHMIKEWVASEDR